MWLSGEGGAEGVGFRHGLFQTFPNAGVLKRWENINGRESAIIIIVVNFLLMALTRNKP